MSILPVSPTAALWHSVQMSYSVVIQGEDRPPMRVLLETLEQVRRFLRQMEPPPGARLIVTDADGVVIDTRVSDDLVVVQEEC